LEQSGLDHGPISVHEKMRDLGMTPVPSTGALARIFRDANVARAEPRKKPRASYRRFVYPAPNACWQLDATDHVLTGGRTCVIFQLLDDHSRYAVASHVASGETAEGAIAVVKKAIAAHGVPQRLLSDNGVALNPSRRGVVGQLVAYVTQTLFRWLDKQPIAATLEQLQEQVDRFDIIYNTERPHQGPARQDHTAASLRDDPDS
jgi:transposase InsO family protein